MSTPPRSPSKQAPGAPERNGVPPSPPRPLSPSDKKRLFAAESPLPAAPNAPRRPTLKRSLATITEHDETGPKAKRACISKPVMWAMQFAEHGNCKWFDHFHNPDLVEGTLVALDVSSSICDVEDDLRACAAALGIDPDSLAIGGGTDIIGNLQSGADQIRREGGEVKHVILFTDAYDNGDTSLANVLAFIHNARKLFPGIQIHLLFAADQNNEENAESIASAIFEEGDVCVGCITGSGSCDTIVRSVLDNIKASGTRRAKSIYVYRDPGSKRITQKAKNSPAKPVAEKPPSRVPTTKYSLEQAQILPVTAYTSAAVTRGCLKGLIEKFFAAKNITGDAKIGRLAIMQFFFTKVAELISKDTTDFQPSKHIGKGKTAKFFKDCPQFNAINAPSQIKSEINSIISTILSSNANGYGIFDKLKPRNPQDKSVRYSVDTDKLCAFNRALSGYIKSV